MMTNRQWLESLNDRQLAEFLTFGIMVKSMHYIGHPFMVNISRIASEYTSSIAGIEKWLSMPQDYELTEGGAE